LDNFGNSNSFNGLSFTNTLGLANVGPQIFFNGLPEVDLVTGTSLNIDRMNGNNEARTGEFADNLSWIRGRHTFKFGLDAKLIRAASPLGFFGADNYGTFAFQS